MKRNLLKGIMMLISAVALSSCSTLTQIAKSDYTGDDVYYTKAKAGDAADYPSIYTQANSTTNARNDDYYYYGDYQTRINRFSYYSPFAYDYDFYYDYNPYYYNNYNYGYSFGGLNQAPVYDYGYSPVYDLGVYSAFDFGYGNYWGFDNYGYGNAYSNYIYGGGTSKRSRIKTYPSVGGVSVGGGNAGNGLSFTRGGTGASANTALQNGLSFSRGRVNPSYPNSRAISSSTVYPGRPTIGSSVQSQQASANRNITNTPAIRPIAENPRQYNPPVIERSAPPSQSSGGSSGSSSSSGGGGRPVRP